jgi:quinoprotein glucose dehydrogenase
LKSAFDDLLFGGNAEAGRRIFFELPEASCAKCHQVGGQGTETGPPLDRSDVQLTRQDILESMLRPNRRITEGYETVILLLKNGSGITGFLKDETAFEIHVLTPDDGLVRINTTDVAVRQRGVSPMPEGLERVLSREQIRDLVEFVSRVQK